MAITLAHGGVSPYDNRIHFFPFLSMIFSYLFIYFALMSYCAFRFLRNHSQCNRIHPSAHNATEFTIAAGL